MSVVGLLILRRRDDPRAVLGAPRYTTWTGNPIIFSSVSALLILRGVVTDPWQGTAIVVVGSLGLGFFHLKFRPRASSLAPV